MTASSTLKRLWMSEKIGGCEWFHLSDFEGPLLKKSGQNKQAQAKVELAVMIE